MSPGKNSPAKHPAKAKPKETPPIECDVLVAGAGAAGLSAAHAFAAQGRKVVVVGKIETHLAGRTVALFEGSLRFYRALGLWPRLAEHSARWKASG